MKHLFLVFELIKKKGEKQKVHGTYFKGEKDWGGEQEGGEKNRYPVILLCKPWLGSIVGLWEGSFLVGCHDL